MKQKAVLSLICLIFSIQYLYSAPITKGEAVKVSTNKLHYLKKTEFTVHSTEVIKFKNQTLFFVVNLSPQGFMVISGDNKLHPVYSYSFTCNFNNPSDEMNNPLKDLLVTDMSNRLENNSKLTDQSKEKISQKWKYYLSENFDTKANTSFIQWPPEGTTSTEGWLGTNWHQSAPYNKYCPMDPVSGERSIAGCPSIALGMIIDYYMTLNETTFTDADDYYHNWGERQYTIDDDYVEQDFLSFPEINSYFTSINTKFDTGEIISDNEAAALAFACGVAATQVYSSGASGTFGVIQAFDAYQKFNFSNAELLYDDVTSTYETLAENMRNGMPAHLAITDPPPVTMGHNVVVDGWNTDNYFHVNFGWGGSYNNWYLIPEGLPYGLTALEGIILNIAEPPVNDGTEFYHFSFNEQSSDAVICSDNIDIEVEYGTDLTDLIPTFQLSLGAKALIDDTEIINGETLIDFSSNPINITVLADNETDSKIWTVNVTIADPNTETEILSFEFAEETSLVTIGSGTIDIEVESDADITSLIPILTLSDGAVAEVDGSEIESGITELDFTSGSKLFVIIAEDVTTTENWTLNVTQAISISEITDKFLIYPNPCKDILRIQGENINKIEIFNSQAKRLQTFDQVNNKFSVDLKIISSGSHLYIIKITDKEGNFYSKKIIID